MFVPVCFGSGSSILLNSEEHFSSTTMSPIHGLQREKRVLIPYMDKKMPSLAYRICPKYCDTLNPYRTCSTVGTRQSDYKLMHLKLLYTSMQTV